MMTPCTAIEIEAEKVHDEVRIVFANQPRLLREMLSRFVARQTGLSVVGMALNPDEWVPRVRETEADCIVVSLDPDGTSLPDLRRLMKECPDLSVLILSPGGKNVHDLSTDRGVQDATPDMIVELLRHTSAS